MYVFIYLVIYLFRYLFYLFIYSFACSFIRSIRYVFIYLGYTEWKEIDVTIASLENTNFISRQGKAVEISLFNDPRKRSQYNVVPKTDDQTVREGGQLCKICSDRVLFYFGVVSLGVR